ncbi:6938_t:CDS:2 [Funneliformis geosporum]|uniref:tRNA-dihydrouridine synthase n=1 Tax=Funneliformis geosporum TaxID=1117311 RepID=A0A9W4SY72_9GLOM|nr:6938_t:CDS:2 [Funneliformis geosporum]CAI2183418.1 838_t:CDS:2 [Funneliformis geosporum]
MSTRSSVLEVFNINNSNPKKYINVCAPMVRYSKLPFRELVRGYNVDLTYTPMILAKEFKNSNIARNSDFTTNKNDKPLIIQFASNDNVELLKAVELIVGYVDGIDVNCGCPQRWAINEGIGVYLMEKPELISDMIRTIKTNIPTLPCSIKIRIHNDLRKTIEFVKRAESIGIDFITVHGRTRRQKSTEPVNLSAIKLIKENLKIPVIANGNIFTLNDAENIYNQTGVNGVMCARGLLRNPALFAGYDLTPWDCVENFVRLSIAYGSNHFILHHHLMYMFEDVMSNAEKKSFNTLTSIPAIIDHLEEYYGLQLE